MQHGCNTILKLIVLFYSKHVKITDRKIAEGVFLFALCDSRMSMHLQY